MFLKAKNMAKTKEQSFKYAFFEGKFVELEKAKVSIMTNALQYGTAVFGGIRGYFDQDKKELSIFRLADHYQRLLSSLRILGVSSKYSQEKLQEITIKLAQMNKPQTDIYFRPFAYASSLELSPNLQRDAVFDFALYSIPLGDYLPVNKGLSVIVSSWRRVSDNAIPARGKISGAYINSALARKEATQLGFNEAIFLTEDGHVSEGSAENLFIVRNGILTTTPKNEDILEGITRRTIIKLAQDLKIPIEERTIDRTELYIADEAFFCGTGVQLAWISSIDKRVIGTGKKGPITDKLQTLFFSVIKGQNEQYSHWCTKLKI